MLYDLFGPSAALRPMSPRLAREFCSAARKLGGTHGLACQKCGKPLRIGSLLSPVVTISGKDGVRYMISEYVHVKCATTAQRMRLTRSED